MSDFSPDEILTMKVLLSRVVRGEDEKKRIDDELAALKAKKTEAEKRRAGAVTAFETFGFDTDDGELWKKVKIAIGEDAWWEAIAMGGRVVKHLADKQNEAAKEAEAEAPEGDEASASDEASDDREYPPAKDGMPTIREIVLAQLAAAAETGIKAADIRRFIEQTYSQTVHEKTVGMTLYRLSKDGLSRREGRTWFSAAPSAKTENPGAATPGPQEGVIG